jgi:chromosome segregation ATPase
MLDRAMFRKSIEQEIDILTEAEVSFSEKLTVYEDADSQWTSLLSQQENAKRTLSTNKVAEIEARKALERAQRMVADAKEHLVITSNALRAVEQQVRKTAAEMDNVTTYLSRNQERVRNALRKKTELVMAESEIRDLTEEDLAALRQKEVSLMGESAQIEQMVARLSSRAEKLRMRAIALERWEQNGRPDPNGANNSTTMGL